MIQTGSQTWLDAVDSHEFDEWTREQMVREMPHTHFAGSIPALLEFLRGAFVDLGFENLGLMPAELRRIMLAFGGGGVAVPGSPHRLRHAAPGHSVVEALDGTELGTLPAHWRQGVLVVGNDDQYTWIGKRVRPDQIGPIDLSQYDDVGDGWKLRSDQP